MENLKKLDGNLTMEQDSNLKRDYMKTADKITDAAKEVESSAGKTLKGIQDYCRKNPGKALGIAAGVGALVSLAIVKALSRKESANEKMVSNVFRKAEKAWIQMKSGIEPALKSIKDSVGA